MRTILIIIAVVMFAGTMTSCKSAYIASGVNQYGTSYVLTVQGDTIYQPTRGVDPYIYPNRFNNGFFYNPYFRPAFGPTIIVRPKSNRNNRVTTPVRGNRGSRGTVPNTPSRPKGSGTRAQ